MENSVKNGLVYLLTGEPNFFDKCLENISESELNRLCNLFEIKKEDVINFRTVLPKREFKKGAEALVNYFS